MLAIVALAAGLLLAGVNRLTTEPIRNTKKKVKLAAIKKVLPECDNDPVEDSLTITTNKTKWTFYVALQDGEYTGAAFQTFSGKGYGGRINMMVGVNSNDAIQAIAILTHAETPGLGAKIEDPAFKNQFRGKDLRKTKWKVKKDKGDIDHITAATISSRAVVDAVRKGVNVYLANKTNIINRIEKAQ
jgi:electron transport complex protein RnfG